MMVDEIVLQEPALLQAAGAMARLALENERLQAEVRSQLVQLRSTTARLVEAAPLPVQVSAPTRRLPSTVESTAYFFATEAVTNAARHSAASVVHVDVTVHGDELTVRVSDNGIGGVDTASPGGSGMLGMRDRVVAVGGRMTVSSPPGGGTTVVASLPCG